MKRILIGASFVLYVVLFFCWSVQAGELHDAVGRGDIAEVRKLLEQGADVNVRDIGQQTPLQIAFFSNKTEMVKLLIEKGADVNAKPGNFPEHYTLLHIAIAFGWTEMGKLFVEKGADVNVRDIDQRTPLQMAVRSNNTALAKLLTENGADVHALDENQQTATMIAELENHPELAALLRKSGGRSTRQDLDAILQNVAKSNYVDKNNLQVIVRLARSLTPPPVISQQAKEALIKGQTAFKMAKQPEELGVAWDYFHKASILAPWWPAPHFNISVIAEKQQYFGDAKEHLEKYLIAAPNAKDIKAVKQKIIELEVAQKLQDGR